jgi:hypothetical protein
LRTPIVVKIETADDSDLARLRAVCRALPEVDEGELQDRPLFRVRRRRFLIYNGERAPARPRWATSGRSIHVLTDPLERPALLQDPRFSRSPHHGDRGWLALRLERGRIDWEEVFELVESAYRRAAPRDLADRLDKSG